MSEKIVLTESSDEKSDTIKVANANKEDINEHQHEVIAPKQDVAIEQDSITLQQDHIATQQADIANMESDSSGTIAPQQEITIQQDDTITPMELEISAAITSAEFPQAEGIVINPAPDPSKTSLPQLSTSTLPAKVQISAKLPKTSLGLLASQYNSDSSEDESDSDGDTIELIGTTDKGQNYRNDVIAINSDSDDSDSDIEIISKTKELQRIIDVDDEDDEEQTNKHRGPIRVKGELLLEDLPPIQDLHITVPEIECAELGKIHSIVDQLVLVDSIPGTVPLNLDTILFLEKGSKVLGAIFDVLGQIANPLYCVRFNSNKQIKERNIEIGQIVYIAPRSEHTQFVILPDMMKIRGSDASWENDIEPSERHLDYSDDEEERSARRAHRHRERSEDVDTSKRPRSTVPQSQVPQQHQYPRESRARPRYQERYTQPNYNPRYHLQNQPMPQSFNYNTISPTWHGNYNQQNQFYPPPPPYAGMPYIPPPGTMQHVIYPPPPPQQ